MDLDDDELRATRIMKGLIEMEDIKKTADEMFQELGYEKYDNHPEVDFPSEPNTWVTQDERVIEYTQKGEVRGNYAREIISFYPRTKNVVCSAFIGNKGTVVPINMQELQAINKKCQELGW